MRIGMKVSSGMRMKSELILGRTGTGLEFSLTVKTETEAKTSNGI
jgi:hypothetical protein